MSKSYANRIELRDGAVILYQKPGAKRGFWYYRIHVRGMHDITGAKVKYDERSTGETDLDEAKRVAFERYDDLKVRVRRNARGAGHARGPAAVAESQLQGHKCSAPA